MYSKGQRVKLVKINDPYTKLVPGSLGTVFDVRKGLLEELQVWVKWDCGSMLALLPKAGDIAEIIKEEVR